MKRTMVVIAMSLGLVALAPSAGHAEGQGNCKVEARVCEFGGAICKDNNGVKGRCRQIGNQCTCFTPQDGAKENAINVIYDSSRTAISFVEDPSSVHQLCGQLDALLDNIELATGRLLSSQLGSIGFVDAELMRRVDVSMRRLPVIGALFTSSCSTTYDPTFVVDGLKAIKERLLDVLEAEIEAERDE